MGREIIRLALSLVFMANTCIAKESGAIVWSNKRLAWQDFSGRPARRNSAASSWSRLDFTYRKIDDHSVEVTVRAVFIRDSSWVKFAQDDILAHEQRHFDIAEIGARQMRQQLAQTHFTQQHYKKQLADVFAKYDEEMDEMQDLYDDESEHSMNTDGQRKWDREVPKMLSGLSAYASTAIIIKLNP